MIPVDNNRWVYTMYGLEKPVDYVPGTCKYSLFSVFLLMFHRN